MKPLATFKDHAMREDAFREGHTLCPGCMEAVTFNSIGRATDNGKKSVFVFGTSCGEVSTLMYPNVVAWGRGAHEPAAIDKSVGVIHNVFESAPTVAEAVRDTASVLEDVGAWKSTSPNVVALSGDGGALAIGLRSLLHTIYRRARVAIFVNINEVFANTGFQYSPTALPFADSSSWPGGSAADPIDHIGLAVVAGAGYVAQASAAFAPLFAEVVDEALACEETAVVFVPTPCISGWKFEEGMTADLAKLASQTGLFPCFRKHKGKPGELKHVVLDKAKRPRVEEFLTLQHRFDHVVKKVDGKAQAVAGREADLQALQSYADRNVERLGRLAQLV